MADKKGNDINEERRKRVFVGALPNDFLRIVPTIHNRDLTFDTTTAVAIQHNVYNPNPPKKIGKLSITVAQAKLVKNYGLTRMDPYVTLRVGHNVYETHSDLGGGKHPKWNKVIHCRLPPGINTVHVKLYDECSLKVDELIAWTEITIPQNVMSGETSDDWYPLSGKQGDRCEGMINLVMSVAFSNVYPMNTTEPFLSYSNAPPVTQYSGLYARTRLSQWDLQQLEEMFPTFDKEVLKTVFIASKGDKQLAVNTLLQMN